jgi:hypothetical protein
MSRLVPQGFEVQTSPNIMSQGNPIRTAKHRIESQNTHFAKHIKEEKQGQMRRNTIHGESYCNHIWEVISITTTEGNKHTLINTMHIHTRYLHITKTTIPMVSYSKSQILKTCEQHNQSFHL